MNSASILICWNDKILLFHRDNIPTISFPDHWSLPGGGVEKGESTIQGLKRELQEEVSYVPQKLEFALEIPRNDGITYGYISFVDDSEAKLFKHGLGEGQEIKFFTIDEALELKLTPELRSYIVIFRTQLEQSMQSKTF